MNLQGSREHPIQSLLFNSILRLQSPATPHPQWRGENNSSAWYTTSEVIPWSLVVGLVATRNNKSGRKRKTQQEEGRHWQREHTHRSITSNTSIVSIITIHGYERSWSWIVQCLIRKPYRIRRPRRRRSDKWGTSKTTGSSPILVEKSSLELASSQKN